MKNKSKKKSNFFVKKLNEILMEKNNQAAISWTSSGEAFRINDIQNFSEKVLPKHFKHRNFSSFVRLLNMYGFHKTKEDLFEYFHPDFKRGEPKLLAKIQRKNSDSVSKQKAVSSLSQRIQKVQNRQNEMEESLKSLQEQYSAMLSNNQDLLTELSESKTRTDSALSVLNSFYNKKNPIVRELESPFSSDLEGCDDWPLL